MGEKRNRDLTMLDVARREARDARDRCHAEAKRLGETIRSYERCVRLKWLCFGTAIGIVVSMIACAIVR